jgi:hypothetical protein
MKIFFSQRNRMELRESVEPGRSPAELQGGDRYAGEEE